MRKDLRGLEQPCGMVERRASNAAATARSTAFSATAQASMEPIPIGRALIATDLANRRVRSVAAAAAPSKSLTLARWVSTVVLSILPIAGPGTTVSPRSSLIAAARVLAEDHGAAGESNCIA